MRAHGVLCMWLTAVRSGRSELVLPIEDAVNFIMAGASNARCTFHTMTIRHLVKSMLGITRSCLFLTESPFGCLLAWAQGMLQQQTLCFFC